MGKGPNGTELYVKIEQSIHDQFKELGRNQWGKVTLGLGSTQLTQNHKLLKEQSDNQYYLVTWVRGNQYRLADGVEVNEEEMGKKLKSGSYKYVELNEKRGGAGWSYGSNFGASQCRYQGDDRKGSTGGRLKIRCVDKDKRWTGDGGGNRVSYISLNITKDDYVLPQE